jgi:type III pantothenate kinase
MIVALDVGNTNVTVALVRDGDVTSSRRFPTDAATSAESLEPILDRALHEEGTGLDEVSEMVVASVVPAVTDGLSGLAMQMGIPILIVDDRTIPMPVRVEQPAAVGDDRLVNGFAASRLYGTPAIVVDLGTATTFDVVNADGSFIGGAIAAGPRLGLDALAARTAQLPRVPLIMPPRAIGGDTVSAMQSGAVIGHIGLVAELVRAISAELAIEGGEAPRVILTGGLSSADWASAIPGVDAIDPLLTLRGLAILHAERARDSTRTESAAPA